MRKKDDSMILPEKKNRQNILVFAGIAAVVVAAVLAAVYFLTQEKPGNELLKVEPPVWNRFVVTIGDSEVNLYREANGSSAQLNLVFEDIESDALTYSFKWNDERVPSGFTFMPYTLSKDNVLPVIGETGEWYKVVVSAVEFGVAECYVSKSRCRQVSAQPVTEQQLKSIKTYADYSATFNLRTEGKYKNICFISQMSEMEGSWIDAAVLYDGVLVNPLTWRADLSKISGGIEGVEQLFEYLPPTKSDKQLESYYFPDVATDRLFTFVRQIGPVPARIPEPEVEENPVITKTIDKLSSAIISVNAALKECDDMDDIPPAGICSKIDAFIADLEQKTDSMTQEQKKRFSELKEKAVQTKAYASKVKSEYDVMSDAYDDDTDF